MIRLQNVTKFYRTDTVETTALNAISLDINEGEFVAITGPSGCGKSTLLNILGLLDVPDKGSFQFSGQEVSSQGEAKLSELRKEKIGFIFQGFNLIDELTVEENVMLPLVYQKAKDGDNKNSVAVAMDRVGVAHRGRHFPKQLSGGQQQRVAIARAIVARPQILLADEPTGNLDSKNGQEVMNILKELNGSGTTIIMVTHSPEHAEFATRTIKMLDGNIQDQG